MGYGEIRPESGTGMGCILLLSVLLLLFQPEPLRKMSEKYMYSPGET